MRTAPGFALAALLLMAAPALAQEAAPSSGNTYVLVVGVEDYADPQIKDLRFAEDDAKAVAAFFRARVGAERVRLLTGKAATRRAVLAALREHLVQRATAVADTAILYFAGHGFADADETYLACQDTELRYLQESAIPLSSLQTRWARIRAGRRLLISDACHSGGLAGLRGFGGIGKRVLASPRGQTPRGVSAVIAATGPSQLSAEDERLGHGVFTATLLDALGGAADADRDGEVDLSELKDYLTRHVPRRARAAGGNQTPEVTVQGEAKALVLATKVAPPPPTEAPRGLRLEFEAPAADAWVKDAKVELRGRLVGAQSVAGATLTLGGVPTPLDARGRFRLALRLGEGEQRLEARARVGQREVRAERRFYVDRTPPRWRQLAPPPRTAQGATCELRLAIEDAAPAVRVELAGADEGLVPRGSPFVKRLRLRDGRNRLALVLRDAAGNVSEGELSLLRVSGLKRPPKLLPPLAWPPRLRWTSELKDAYVETPVGFSGDGTWALYVTRQRKERYYVRVRLKDGALHRLGRTALDEQENFWGFATPHRDQLDASGNIVGISTHDGTRFEKGGQPRAFRADGEGRTRLFPCTSQSAVCAAFVPGGVLTLDGVMPRGPTTKTRYALVRHEAGRDPEILREESGRFAAGLQVSPDGRRAAYFTLKIEGRRMLFELRVVDPSSGELLGSAPLKEGEHPPRMAWDSASSGIYFHERKGGPILRYEVAKTGGRVQPVGKHSVELGAVLQPGYLAVREWSGGRVGVLRLSDDSLERLPADVQQVLGGGGAHLALQRKPEVGGPRVWLGQLEASR